MAKTVCRARKQGIVRERGKASIEFYKDGKPQYYCYGYGDPMTDELLEVCKNCIDHVDSAEAERDYEEWQKEKERRKE